MSATVLAEPSVRKDDVPRRTATIAGRTYEVVLPTWGDPRLALSATIIGLQILGQTVLGFEVSITQILLAIGTAAVLELVIVAWQRQQIIWPASAIQSGNGIGLIMRVPGTEHGDWWSTRGWALFVGVAAIAVFSKYAIRWGERHVFNPSNFALVLAFVVLGTEWVDPQALWWGPMSLSIVAALSIIAFGGVFATFRAGVLRVAASFYLSFGVLLALLAASGHWMTARWSAEPILDFHYWWIVMTSPEILVFVLFMITDPRTIPGGATARVAFGMVLGAVATLMVAPFHTEFWTKVNILAALVVCCAFRPAFERWVPASTPPLRATVSSWVGSPRRLAGSVGAVAVLGVAIVGLGVPSRDVASESVSVVRAGVDGERPDVDTPSDVPITLGEAGGIAGTVDPPVARRAASDVLANIAIEAEALRLGDVRMAATATFGDQLARIQQQIGSGGPVDVTTVDPEHVTVLWVRGTGGAQSPPQLAVTVWGTATTRAFDRGQPVGAPTTSAYARTFLTADAGDVFLTSGETDAIGDRGGPSA